MDLATRTATQFGFSYWGIDAQAQISCKALLDSNAGGIVTVNLTADYNFVPPTVSDHAGTLKFIGRNAQKAASLYWGESIALDVLCSGTSCNERCYYIGLGQLQLDWAN